jgi:hypothetical protein
MSTNKINELYQLLPSERQAKQYVEYFLNENKIPKTLFKNPNEDLNCYWAYFNRAEDTEAKEQVL